jgi:hypothetical protein
MRCFSLRLFDQDDLEDEGPDVEGERKNWPPYIIQHKRLYDNLRQMHLSFLKLFALNACTNDEVQPCNGHMRYSFAIIY